MDAKNNRSDDGHDCSVAVEGEGREGGKREERERCQATGQSLCLSLPNHYI